MKKRLFYAIAIIMIAVVCMLTFVACNKDESDTEWTVTFDPNYEGGPEALSIKVTDGSTLPVQAGLTREGYTFIGWYVDKEGTTEFKFGTTEDAMKITEDTTLYAKWTKEQVAVTLTSITAEYKGGELAINGQVASKDVTVTAHYSDNTSKVVTNFTIATVDSKTSGKKTVLIYYTEGGVNKTTSITVTVKAEEQPQDSLVLASINASYTGTVVIGGEAFDPTKVTVTAVYTDGTTANLTANDFVITNINSVVWTEAGDVTLNISYTENNVEKTTTLTITVLAEPVAELTSILAVYNNGNVDIEFGGQLDLTKLVVTGYYDEETEGVAINVEDCVIEGFDSSKSGEQEITVTYGKLTTYFTVNVLAEVISEDACLLVVGTESTAMVKNENATTEEFMIQGVDFNGTVGFNITYKGSTYGFDVAAYAQDVQCQADATNNNIILAEGKYDIYFKVNEGIWIQKTVVELGDLTGIEVTYSGETTIYVNEQIDTTKILVTGTYQNGTAIVLEYTIEEYDTSVAQDNVVITVKVGDIKDTFTIKVIDKPADTCKFVIVNTAGVTEKAMEINTEATTVEYMILGVTIEVESEIKVEFNGQKYIDYNAEAGIVIRVDQDDNEDRKLIIEAGKYNIYFKTVDNTMFIQNAADQPQPTTAPIYFKAPSNWTEVYAYAWTGEGESAVEFFGKFPGQVMTAVGTEHPGWFTIDVNSTAENIIFNKGIGGEGNQTNNIALDANARYYDGSWYTTYTQDEPAPTITGIRAQYNGNDIVVGGELNKNDIQVFYVYSEDGKETEVSAFDISGFESTTKGPKTVTVTVVEDNKTYTTTVEVLVVEQEQPEVVVYKVLGLNGEGDEAWLFDNGITMTKNEGQTAFVEYMAEITVDGQKGFKIEDSKGNWYSNVVAGQTGFTQENGGNIVITEAGKYNVYFNLTSSVISFVKISGDEPEQPTLTKITAEYKGNNVIVDTLFDKGQIKVYGTYSDNGTAEITEYTLTALDTATIGTQTLTVTVGNLTATVDVTVVPEPGTVYKVFGINDSWKWEDGVEMVKNGDKNEYVKSALSIEKEAQIKISDGTNWYGELKANCPFQYSTEGNIILPVGTYDIYLDFAEQGKIWIAATSTQTEPTITGIRAEYKGNDIEVEGQLAESDIKVYYVYSDETEKEITTGITLRGFDSATEGVKTVTVIVDNYTATVKVNVVSKVVIVYKVLGINGEGDEAWLFANGITMTKNEAQTAYVEYMAEITVDGQKGFKIEDSKERWYANVEAGQGGYTTDKDGNIVISEAGKYNVYLKIMADATVISFGKVTGGDEPAPTITGIRAQYNGNDIVVGGELNKNDIQVFYVYSEDGKETEVSAFDISGFESRTAGDKIVTVSVDNNTYTTTVTVKVIDTITLYYFNTNKWNSVSAYAWSGNGDTAVQYLGGFPGQVMTAVGTEHPDWYKIDVNAKAEKVIFSDGIENTTNKTLDLTLVAGSPYYDNGVWYDTFDGTIAANFPVWASANTLIEAYSENGVIIVCDVMNVKEGEVESYTITYKAKGNVFYDEIPDEKREYIAFTEEGVYAYYIDDNQWKVEEMNNFTSEEDVDNFIYTLFALGYQRYIFTETKYSTKAVNTMEGKTYTVYTFIFDNWTLTVTIDNATGYIASIVESDSKGSSTITVKSFTLGLESLELPDITQPTIAEGTIAEENEVWVSADSLMSAFAKNGVSVTLDSVAPMGPNEASMSYTTIYQVKGNTFYYEAQTTNDGQTVTMQKGYLVIEDNYCVRYTYNAQNNTWSREIGEYSEYNTKEDVIYNMFSYGMDKELFTTIPYTNKTEGEVQIGQNVYNVYIYQFNITKGNQTLNASITLDKETQVVLAMTYSQGNMNVVETVTALAFTCEDLVIPTATQNICFYNKDGWEDVYAYVWTDKADESKDEQLGKWAGTKMTPIENASGWYEIDVPVDAVNIIFNNNNGAQTNDLVIDYVHPYYNYAEDKWQSAIGSSIIIEPIVTVTDGYKNVMESFRNATGYELPAIDKVDGAVVGVGEWDIGGSTEENGATIDTLKTINDCLAEQLEKVDCKVTGEGLQAVTTWTYEVYNTAENANYECTITTMFQSEGQGGLVVISFTKTLIEQQQPTEPAYKIVGITDWTWESGTALKVNPNNETEYMYIGLVADGVYCFKIWDGQDGDEHWFGTVKEGVSEDIYTIIDGNIKLVEGIYDIYFENGQIWIEVNSYDTARNAFKDITGLMLPAFPEVRGMCEELGDGMAMLDINDANEDVWTNVQSALSEYADADPEEGQNGSLIWNFKRETEDATYSCQFHAFLDSGIVVIMYSEEEAEEEMTSSYALAREGFESVTGVLLPAIAGLEVEEYPLEEGDTSYCFDICEGDNINYDTFTAFKDFMDELDGWTFSMSREVELCEYYYYIPAEGTAYNGTIELVWFYVEDEETVTFIFINAMGGQIIKPEEEPEEEQEDTYSYVYYYNESGWNTLYAYAWTSKNEGGADEYLGEWPGTEMEETDVEGWFVVLVNDKAVNIKFSNNGQDETGAFALDEDARYLKYGQWYEENPDGQAEETLNVYFYNADYWTNVYAYAWSGEDNDAVPYLGKWPGTKMGEGAFPDWYVIAVDINADYIVFNNGLEGQEEVKTINLALEEYRFFDGKQWIEDYPENIPDAGDPDDPNGDEEEVNDPPQLMVIYYYNVSEWNAVYAYAWSGEGNDTVTYLGDFGDSEQMHELNGRPGWYFVFVDVNAEYIIFYNGNSGEGNQTGNLTIEGNAYDGEEWYDRLPVDEHIYLDLGDQANDWFAADAEIYCYVWYDDESNNNKFPGKLMETNEDGLCMISYDYDAENPVVGVIFVRKDPNNPSLDNNDLWAKIERTDFDPYDNIFYLTDYADGYWMGFEVEPSVVVEALEEEPF